MVARYSGERYSGGTVFGRNGIGGGGGSIRGFTV